MSTMSEHLGPTPAPEARVTVLRRSGGYAVVAVMLEGPFSREEAAAKASELSGLCSRSAAAKALGISPKGVDYLVERGKLTRNHGQITKASVAQELASRGE